jgi:ubiquitin fusion degradation protein 1
VLEFVADEGKVYIPYWMMQNLSLEEGGFLTVESASLPVATFARFQPHSCDFLDLTNQKAVLESRLRNFACLSTGDVIAIFYNDKTYELSVLETKPAAAVSVIECDLNVDFAPPVGYKEPTGHKKTGGAEGGKAGDEEEEELQEPMDVTDLMPKTFSAFSGEGNRLDGKKKKSGNSESEAVAHKPKVEYVRGIPDYDYEVGTLSFIRWKPKKAKAEDNGEDGGGGFEAFKGEGKSLRAAAADKSRK